jgi:hypothetical protein
MLLIQRATVHPSPYSGGCKKEFDEFVQQVEGGLTFDSDIYRTPSNRTRFVQRCLTLEAAMAWRAYCECNSVSEHTWEAM